MSKNRPPRHFRESRHPHNHLLEPARSTPSGPACVSDPITLHLSSLTVLQPHLPRSCSSQESSIHMHQGISPSFYLDDSSICLSDWLATSLHSGIGSNVNSLEMKERYGIRSRIRTKKESLREPFLNHNS